jgi:hypothetical protein
MDFIEMTDKLKVKELIEFVPSSDNQTDIVNDLNEQLDISRFVSIANFTKINSKHDARQVLSMSLQSRKLKQTLEKTRKKIVQPHVDFQRAINAIVKDYTNKLQEIENNLQSKLSKWFEEQAEDADFSDLIMEVNNGKMNTKKTYTFEIDDVTIIPTKYLKVDEKKVKEAIKMGVRNIPGIKIKEETNLTMRVKNE